ncbi:Fur family transcriptional regulator [Fulvimarina sp. 2208YS6-2-32]|uniref:Fur family transcriptional regulator n=1 Tax=Fulvimarina uroteuthidis TaxID=3098149 RepID=A0ABU5I0A6_9HYPH|nr:Fur family transcriptional regulator [Fulvimarina sp. 2208YS6-2-32]MDY8107601.1 Fur family transcriptional regulator [Fulvimarina sp. 2208YS6-2-32]
MSDDRHAHAPIQKLTRNQSLVLGELRGAERPMSAYAILDRLRAEGLKAPLQVYRALDKLVAIGSAHRLESLNAFVACSHGGCSDHSATGFLICETCGSVAEFEDEDLSDDLTRRGEAKGFAVRRANIELIGMCSICNAA